MNTIWLFTASGGFVERLSVVADMSIYIMLRNGQQPDIIQWGARFFTFISDDCNCTGTGAHAHYKEGFCVYSLTGMHVVEKQT